MDPILGELRTALADLTPEIPTIPFYSTVMEGFASPMLDADYWVANVRQPALLSQAVAAAAEEHGTFIEISAHPILTNAVADTVDAGSHHHSVGTLWRDGDDAVRFHTNLNAVHTSHPPQTPHPVEPHPLLPTTPWHHSRFWVDPRPITPMQKRCRRYSSGHATPTGRSRRSGIWTWPGRSGNCPGQKLPGTTADASSSWLVITDSGLGDEIGRVLGDDVHRNGRADVVAGRGSRPVGDRRCAGRGEPRALRAAGHRRPIRFRSRLRTVQRRAPAHRGHRRTGSGAKAFPADA